MFARSDLRCKADVSRRHERLLWDPGGMAIHPQRLAYGRDEEQQSNSRIRQDDAQAADAVVAGGSTARGDYFINLPVLPTTVTST